MGPIWKKVYAGAIKELLYPIIFIAINVVHHRYPLMYLLTHP